MIFRERLSMQLLNMPLFDLFIPVIQKHFIQDWTANDFWEQLKLSKKERNRFNRQRMYRILRKLVEFVFLEKKINQNNPKFSRFKETNKLNEFRNLDNSKIDLFNMKSEEEKINFEIIFLEKQSEKYKKLEIDFPNIKHKISNEKDKCSSQLIELRAYQCALKSVIASL